MNSQAVVIGKRLQQALDLLGGCGAQVNHGDVRARGRWSTKSDRSSDYHASRRALMGKTLKPIQSS
jgi:hypothetical protein